MINYFCRHLYQYEASASRLAEVLKASYHFELTDAEATEYLKECTGLSLIYHSSDIAER
jgi:hypothetical protein